HIITVPDPEDRDGENEVAKRAAAHARHPREEEKADNVQFLAGSGQRTGGRENGDACVVEGGNEVHACAGTPCQDDGRPVGAARLLSSSANDGCPRSQGLATGLRVRRSTVRPTHRSLGLRQTLRPPGPTCPAGPAWARPWRRRAWPGAGLAGRSNNPAGRP